MRYLLIVLLFIFYLFLSCRKPEDKKTEPANINNINGVFITNEGNYGWGNASISYYNLKTGELIPDIYKQANGIPLGDVCQSITYFDSKYYIVVNNSNKIEIVNSQDFKSIASIHNLVSPRYFLPVSSNKAYISDLYDNKIAVANLTNNTIIKHINCTGSTEEMLSYHNTVYVTNTRNSYLYLIDTLTDLITDSIMVGVSPFSIKIDRNERIWVLCAGNSSNNGSLCKVNPLNKTVEKSFNFSGFLNVWNRLKINNSKDTLYFINHDIFQMPVNSSDIPQTPIILKGSYNFYGLGIEPDNGNIFVSDAMDYVQKGKVYIYNQTNGNLLKSFIAGIIPGDFLFN